MKARSQFLFLSWALATAAAGAADGLVAPTPESLWPGWHARISLQTVEDSSSTSLLRPLDGSRAMRSLQGGALLGDYTLAQPSFGTFRATSGLVMGPQGGAPLLSMTAGPRLGLAVQSGGLRAPPSAGNDMPNALPYLGLGFFGSSLGMGLSISADIGVVGENQGSGGSLGRALLGNQGIDSALREYRLSPMLQVGVRYTF